MTETTNTEAGFVATTAEEWSFISGRIAVMETSLLNRGFFESLLKSKTLADVRSSLGKTQYRQFFTSDDSLRDYMGVLDRFHSEISADILKYTPPHVLNCIFDLPQRYQVFRNMFIKICQRNGSVGDLESVFDAFVTNGIESAAVAPYRAMLRGRETPQSADSVSRSLFLDSVACSVRIGLSEAAQELKVREPLTALAVLQAWTAILRSRWNGTSPELVMKWFILPGDYAEFVKDTAMLSLTNPVLPLSGRVSDKIQKKMKNIPLDSLRQNVDFAVNESVRDEIIEMRYIPYGPEKVVSYFLSLGVELDNMRLSLASVVNGIDSKIVIERLRKEYA